MLSENWLPRFARRTRAVAASCGTVGPATGAAAADAPLEPRVAPPCEPGAHNAPSDPWPS